MLSNTGLFFNDGVSYPIWNYAYNRIYVCNTVTIISSDDGCFGIRKLNLKRKRWLPGLSSIFV